MVSEENNDYKNKFEVERTEGNGVTITQTIEMQATEDMDRFIFNVIYPFCKETAGMEISKKELADAIILLRRCKSYHLDMDKLNRKAISTANDVDRARVQGYKEGVAAMREQLKDMIDIAYNEKINRMREE